MPFAGNPDLVPEDVKDNYAQLNKQGRSWEGMADTAEKAGDPHLAAHLRKQAAETQPAARTAAPANRTATPSNTQIGAKK